MTNIIVNKVTRTTVTPPDIRSTLTKHRTAMIESVVFDKVTSEFLGNYTYSEYIPEPLDNPIITSQEPTEFYVDGDGSPISVSHSTKKRKPAAKIFTLPTTKPVPIPKIKTGKGRKEQIIQNPLHVLFEAIRFDNVPTPWLENYIHGAINTGPGRVNGKYSVSPSDVTRMLRLAKISVVNASECLLNHERELMSVRQIQRVVQAARVALRGIALYLERHPEIMQTIGIEINFDSLWTSASSASRQSKRKIHPKRQEVMELLSQKTPIKEIVRQTGVSKTTINKWLKELSTD